MLSRKKWRLDQVTIVPATEVHVQAISRLTGSKDMLKRTPEEIWKYLPDFIVALDGQKKVIGCFGSKNYGSDIELISLRVTKRYRGLGLGKMLIKRKLKDHKNSGCRIFALTKGELADSHFLPLGFVKVGIQLFDGKVMGDCRKCKKNFIDQDGCHRCDEIAVLYLGNQVKS